MCAGPLSLPPTSLPPFATKLDRGYYIYFCSHTHMFHSAHRIFQFLIMFISSWLISDIRIKIPHRPHHGALPLSRICDPIIFGGTGLGIGPRLPETRARLLPKVGAQIILCYSQRATLYSPLTMAPGRSFHVVPWRRTTEELVKKRRGGATAQRQRHAGDVR